MAGTLTTTSDERSDAAGHPVPRSHRWARRLAIVTTGVLAFMMIAWVLSDPVENLSTDWTAFDRAADRLFDGGDLYRPYDAEAEPLPYLYPPYALWLVLPLAAFGFSGSFVLSALLSAGSLVAGVLLMSRAGDGEVDRTTGVVMGLASGAALSSVLIGQYSGLYALAIGAATRAYTTERRWLAGALLALLWIKPNLAIAVPVALVWSRSWRMLTGFSVATTTLFASSLAFGVGRWDGFVSNAQMMAELQEDGVVPFRKMVTLLGSAQTALDVRSLEPALIVFWLGTTALLGLAVLRLWRADELARSPIRAFGALALFVVAANPRLYFYDATLVVVGVLGVWIASQTDGRPERRRLVSIAAALAWFSLWGGVFVSLNVLVGPMAALVLALAATDSRGPSGPLERSDRPMRLG